MTEQNHDHPDDFLFDIANELDLPAIEKGREIVRKWLARMASQTSQARSQ